MGWAGEKTPRGSPWTLLLVSIGAPSKRSGMRGPRLSLSSPSLPAESEFATAGPGFFLHGEALEDEFLALQMTGGLHDVLRRTGSTGMPGIPLGRTRCRPVGLGDSPGIPGSGGAGPADGSRALALCHFTLAGTAACAPSWWPFSERGLLPGRASPRTVAEGWPEEQVKTTRAASLWHYLSPARGASTL